MKLDSKNIASLEPDGKLYQDIVEKGLYLRNRPEKKWVVVKYANKKRVFITLGSFPDMNISSARKAAAMEKAKFLQNKNDKHYSTLTLMDVFLKYERQKEDLRSMWQKKVRINSMALYALTHKRLTEISSEDLRNLKKRMENAPSQFNQYRALISALFNFAIREMELELVNPVPAVQKYPEKAKDSFLSMEFAGRFFEALSSGKYSRDFCDIVILLIELGQRKGNTFAMKWSDIDFENQVWTIPKEKSKNKKDMFIPLTPDSIAILKRRADVNKDPVWVFPRQKAPVTGPTRAGYSRQEGEGHIVDIRRQLRTLLKDIGAPENLTIHDLRRTHGMWMLNAGASIEQVSRSLNHSSIAITQKVYAKMLVDPVREAQRLMLEKVKGVRSN